MKRSKPRDESKRIEEAKALVRKILVDQAGQKLDEETLNSVANKIVRALPPRSLAETRARKVSSVSVND
jgi:hypothetical protein